jgi:hypothetical protein
MNAPLVVHVGAGLLGLVSGYIALYATKGAPLHRRVGMVFVYAMLTMSMLGALIAIVSGVAPEINVPAALLTAYLVTTALITVRPASGAPGISLYPVRFRRYAGRDPRFPNDPLGWSYRRVPHRPPFVADVFCAVHCRTFLLYRPGERVSRAHSHNAAAGDAGVRRPGDYVLLVVARPYSP